MGQPAKAETLADPVTIIASEHVPDGTLPMFGMSALRMTGHSLIECYGTRRSTDKFV